MQVQRKTAVPVAEKPASERTRADWVWLHEAFADLNLADLTCTKGAESISQSCWQGMFSKLDRNADGAISAGDLHRVEDEEKNARNLTRKALKMGVALLAQWYPEESTRLVMNEPLIVALAFQGVVPPKNASAPEDPLAAVPRAAFLQARARLGPQRANASAALELYGAECVEGVVQVATATIGIAFGILGIELPNSGLIADSITSNVRVVNTILEIVRAMDDVDDAGKIAKDIFGIIRLLYDEGVLTAAIQDSLSSLGWWEWAVVAAQLTATVASWFVTGGAGLVIQIALVAFDAVDLLAGVRKVQQDCF